MKLKVNALGNLKKDRHGVFFVWLYNFTVCQCINSWVLISIIQLWTIIITYVYTELYDWTDCWWTKIKNLSIKTISLAPRNNSESSMEAGDAEDPSLLLRGHIKPVTRCIIIEYRKTHFGWGCHCKQNKSFSLLTVTSWQFLYNVNQKSVVPSVEKLRQFALKLECLKFKLPFGMEFIISFLLILSGTHLAKTRHL